MNARENSTPSSAPSGFAESVCGKRLLLVDDEPDQFKIVSAYFRGTDVILGWSASGREALEALRQQRYDMFILDIMMPDIDGWELFSQIRKMPEYRNTPVLFLSCIMSPELEEIATDESRHCRTLSKPTTSAAFRDAVNDLLI